MGACNAKDKKSKNGPKEEEEQLKSSKANTKNAPKKPERRPTQTGQKSPQRKQSDNIKREKSPSKSQNPPKSPEQSPTKKKENPSQKQKQQMFMTQQTFGAPTPQPRENPELDYGSTSNEEKINNEQQQQNGEIVLNQEETQLIDELIIKQDQEEKKQKKQELIAQQSEDKSEFTFNQGEDLLGGEKINYTEESQLNQIQEIEDEDDSEFVRQSIQYTNQLLGFLNKDKDKQFNILKQRLSKQGNIDPEDNENDFKKKLAKVLFKRRINLKQNAKLGYNLKEDEYELIERGLVRPLTTIQKKTIKKFNIKERPESFLQVKNGKIKCVK